MTYYHCILIYIYIYVYMYYLLLVLLLLYIYGNMLFIKHILLYIIIYHYITMSHDGGLWRIYRYITTANLEIWKLITL